MLQNHNETSFVKQVIKEYVANENQFKQHGMPEATNQLLNYITLAFGHKTRKPLV